MVITFQRWITGTSILGLIALLAACGGGGSSGKPTPTSVASSTPIVSSSALSSSTISSELGSSSLRSSSSSSAMPVLMGGAIQGHPLNIATVVSTFAGAARGGDGIGAAARFNDPRAIVRDGGDLYVADSNNYTIRKIVMATGAVTTLAGTAGLSGDNDGTGAAARFNDVSGITTDGTNLYVAESLSIRKIVIATGVVTTLAGSGGNGLTTDGTSLYVTDNSTIRKIVIATGVVTTVAGTVGVKGSVDGAGAAASFNYPNGIATDGTNLFVADSQNQTIRKIVIATGVVTTLAGTTGINGSADGTGAAARFTNPDGIATDGTNLYMTDFNTIRKIVIATGAVTTLAGGGSGSADGTGVAASFFGPEGITTDGTNLYIADSNNYTIRKIVIATGAVTTLAGVVRVSAEGSVDGIGGAASFDRPNGITTDGTNLYVADTWNNTIRKVVIATGEVSTLAGGGRGSEDGIGAAASFNDPVAITTDGTNLYVTDSRNYTIRKIVIATGAVTTLAGTAGASGSADGTGAAARFSMHYGITTDGTNLYVADSNNYTIRKVVIATGVVTTLAGTAQFRGNADGIGAAAIFYFPEGITTDGTNLYVDDTVNNTIRKIVIATGAVTTYADIAASGITTDGTNLYVAGDTIRKIDIATGAVTTLAGTEGVYGSMDGVGSAASFYRPYGITTDGFNLFVTDTYNNTIRKIH